MPAPSSDGGSNESSSPGDMLTTLRSFRLQNHTKMYPRVSGISSLPASQSSLAGSSPESSRSTMEVPETPESQRVKNQKSYEVDCDDGPDSTTSPRKQDTPSLAQKLLKYRHSPASGSSDSTTEAIMKEHKEQAMDEYDEFCGKEQSLKALLQAYPCADIMEAQDILVRTGWNLRQAIELAKKMPLKAMKKAAAGGPSQKGVVFKDPQSSDDEVQIVQRLDEDSDDNGIVVTDVHSRSNGITSNNSFSRKRKKMQVISDSDDEDGVAPLQSYVKDEEQNAIVSDGSQHPSTKFSVLEYSPSNSNSFKNSALSSSVSPGGSRTEIRTYSSTKPRQSISQEIESFDVNPLVVGKPKKQAAQKKHAKPKNSSKETKKKRRRKMECDTEDDIEEEYGNCDVYDSEDSDCEKNLTPARNAVLTFFQDARTEELITIPGCSNRKADAIISYRPFGSWKDLIQKFEFDKVLSTDLLNGAKKVLDMRTAVSRLMNKCQKIALEMEDLVEALKENKEHGTDYVEKQPDLLNPNMHLTSYQMLGLNWLLLMHNQEVNGILADEMGLGKTVQAISFLAYLKQQSVPGPHLIVVPSSTLDNWRNELNTWWPSVSILCYYGSQDNRRELRIQIMEDEIDEFDVMITTYNMVASSAEDRNFFKKLDFEYVIFDEAHMLKNMASQRYQHLMRVKAARRLLLTGTPLQNNLVELMSLLIFAVPHMFSGKTEQVKQMFSAVCKTDEGKTKFERERIEHAKRIMKPFVLRRLKSEVLKDLPKKHEEVKLCPMSTPQSMHYKNLVQVLSEEVRKNKEEKEVATTGGSMLMQLRKAANHQLLSRIHYTDDKLRKMSKLMLKEPTHKDANPDLVFEDMSVMSDFELHRLCKTYKSLKSHCLDDKEILDSGKFAELDNLLPKSIEEGNRILLFSQFTMVLDIVEEYMKIRKYKYLRLDGQIPVHERQQLIDEYNHNENIPVFLLSTRAGGLGINLTAANVVLIHDIDFNPYNDKQAEDRCHRVGQKRDVTVIRMISEGTIEEGMLQRASEKLKLEKDITSNNDDEEKDSASVAKLLRDALGLSQPAKS